MARLSPERLVYTSAYGARDPIKTAAGVTESFHWGVDYGPDVRNKRGVILCAVFAGTATHLHDQYGALGVRVTSSVPDLLNQLSRIYGTKIAAGTSVALDLWHLAARAVGTNIKVGEGAAVGEMGSTGRSTGVHVHVELRIGKVRVDPKPFIDAQASKAVAPAPDNYKKEWPVTPFLTRIAKGQNVGRYDLWTDHGPSYVSKTDLPTVEKMLEFVGAKKAPLSINSLEHQQLSSVIRSAGK